jgi:putative ABC transport system permease protein
MNRLRIVLVRLASLFSKRRQDDELDDEVEAHLDLLAEERVRLGMSPVAARAAARREFGGVDQVKESYRDQRGLPLLDALGRDLRYAARSARKNPGFTAVAVTTLAIGIGANTALFSIVNAVLLRPLPFANSDRLVSLSVRTPLRPRSLLTYREYLTIRDQVPSLEATGLWLTQSVNLTGTQEPERITGAFVSGSFFETLGLAAERGRLFTEPESEPERAKPFVVITHAFWLRRFGGSSSVLGQSLTLNGAPFTIVGVLAPPFDAATVPAAGWVMDTDLFVPAGAFPGRNNLASPGPALLGVARFRKDVTVDTVNADLEVVSKRLQAEFPETQTDRSARAVELHESLVGQSRPALMLLLASVGAVLLIACVNVSNLLLARALDRQKEMALRTALGAGRWILMRQLAVEAGLLAVVSALVGLVIGRWSLQVLTWMSPPNVPIPDRIPLDGTVLLFTMLTASTVAAVCALAPAFRMSGVQLTDVVQAGSRRTSSTGRRTREALVVVELALSVVLVAVSGLLIQSLMAVQRVPLGFEPDHVFTLAFRLPPAKYPEREDIARFFRQAIAEIRVIPGVESAALVRAVPLSGNGGEVPFTVEGRPSQKGAGPDTRYHLVTPDYFKTMRIGLVQGRDFTDRDDLGAPLVAIVNETFARTIWPSGDALGKRISTPDMPGWLTIVGIVRDAKHFNQTELPRPQLYVSHYQNPQIFSSLVARTAVAPMAIADSVRKAIWSVDPDQPVWATQSLDAIVDSTQGSWRFLAMLLGLFAIAALTIASVGIYGVMSYSVSQRTHEIGVRLALGAPGSTVRREVVARGLLLTGAAIVAGLVVAAATARVAANVLFGVQPTDPVTFLISTVILALVALAACYIPARRASRVDPLVALRQD